MRIGLLSDTHIPEAGPQLWDQVHEAFAGVDLILHGGDIFEARVLDRLEQIAPVYAALGNHDQGLVADPRVAPTHWLELEGFTVALLHCFEPLHAGMAHLAQVFLEGRRPDIVVHGDSHFERIEWVDGVLVINPGSPTLPRNLSSRLGHIGFLTLERGRKPIAELVDLAAGANDHALLPRPGFL